MKTKLDDIKYVQYLEQRLQHLEELNRFTPDALEMAASLGDFQSSINKLRSADGEQLFPFQIPFDKYLKAKAGN